MRRVIIFGTNHYNTAGLVRSLGEKGIKSDLFLVRTKKSQCSMRFSRYVSKIYYLEREDEASDILRHDYWIESEKPICFFGSDAWIAFFDAHFNEFKDKLVLPNVRGEQGAINRLLDKINSFPVAEKCGFDLIKTWYVRDANNVPHDITFPCIVKGNNSTKSEKSDMAVFSSYEELTRSLRDGVEYLVQEYIEKDYELNMIGLAYNHGKSVYLPAVIRKIRDELQLPSCYFRVEDINSYPNINQDNISNLLRSLGYEGLFSIEVLCKGPKCYFLEINLRNDACCYAYTKAGVNYPYMWVMYNIGQLTNAYIAEISLKSPLYAMSFADLRNLQKGKVPFLTWLVQFLTADVFMQFTVRDLLPVVHVVYKHVMALFRRWQQR